MGRGSDVAQGAATDARGISGTAATNAGELYSTLAPGLMSEAAHPAGFAPTDLASMNTDVQQSAGGTQAAAVGQGALQTARTRNAGGTDAAIGVASRGAGETASRGALATQMANAKLKESQHRAAVSGLEGLYGTNMGTSVGALGQVASNVHADNEAEQGSWDWTKGVNAIANLASSASGFKGLGG